MRTISVLINARLGSSRVSRKLVRPFAGRTLIEIALEKIDRMGFLEHRYFGVAEEELAKFASALLNVELLKRSPESVRPGYGDHNVIFAHYRFIESDFIFWLNPCHSLLSIDTVKRAVDHFRKTDFNSYTSVVPTKDWIFDGAGRAVTNTSASMLSTNHSPKYSKVAHSFHIFSKDYFLKTNNCWSLTKDDPHLIEIPEDENFDVDTPTQFETAQAVYRARHLSKKGDLAPERQ